MMVLELGGDSVSEIRIPEPGGRVHIPGRVLIQRGVWGHRLVIVVPQGEDESVDRSLRRCLREMTEEPDFCSLPVGDDDIPRFFVYVGDGKGQKLARIIAHVNNCLSLPV